MRVRLTRKFAERIDGVDLSNVGVGDIIDLPERKARTLVAEGWGEFLGPTIAAGSHAGAHPVASNVLEFARDDDRRQLERERDDVSRAS
jgi:hypothetical protein